MKKLIRKHNHTILQKEKNMKRLISMFVLISMMITISSFSALAIDGAYETHDEGYIGPNMSGESSEDSSSNNLYILTYPCPEDIIEYVAENISQSIRAAMKDSAMWDSEDNLSELEVRVGQPFTYSEFVPDMFTFPVYVNDKITFTYRVGYSPNNRICGTLSRFLAKELNNYLGDTSISEPLRFNIEDGTLYGVLNNNSNEIAQFYFYDEAPSNSIQTASDDSGLMIENLSDYFDFDLSLSTTRDPARFLNLSITEGQVEGLWCTAYSMAAILRTQLKSSCTARDIMNYFGYGEDKALSVLKALEYAQQAGLKSTLYSQYALRDALLMTEIDAYRPVFMVYDVLNKPAAHAMVLRGYAVADTEWSIWDPLYPDSYQYYSMLDLYQSPDGTWFDYKFDGRTLYNCKR